MSVGNDVVDLADPETRLRGLHPRFAERVFSTAERDALEAALERLATTAPALGVLGGQGERLQGPEAARAGDGLLAEGVRGRPLAAAPGGGGGRGRRAGSSTVAGSSTLEVRHDGASVHAIATSADARTLACCGGSSGLSAIPAWPSAGSPPTRSARRWASTRPACGSCVGHRWRPTGVAGSRPTCRCPTTAASSPSPARWPASAVPLPAARARATASSGRGTMRRGDVRRTRAPRHPGRTRRARDAQGSSRRTSPPPSVTAPPAG